MHLGIVKRGVIPPILIISKRIIFVFARPEPKLEGGVLPTRD
jgi:hypothetical protein